MIQHDYDPTSSISEEQYSQYMTTKGVVILAVNSTRYWGCGGFENAELRSIGFDLFPQKGIKDSPPPDFVINGSADGPKFMLYVFMLQPGNYAISHIKIKVANSISDVGYLTANRSNLFNGSSPTGGTFDISAGEVVYIGHFGLDCTYQPTLWRYYKKDKEMFSQLIETLQSYIPYVNWSDVQYRLFETEPFGQDFTLE
jgi:hypothetical protein